MEDNLSQDTRAPTSDRVKGSHFSQTENTSRQRGCYLNHHSFYTIMHVCTQIRDGGGRHFRL